MALGGITDHILLLYHRCSVPAAGAGYGGLFRPSSSPLAFLTTCAIIVCSYAIVVVLRSLVLRPASQRRALLQQGVHVGPYRPLAGDLAKATRMKVLAQRSPLPSPSDHHLLFAYLYPFYHQRISQLQGPDPVANDVQPFVVWIGSRPTLFLTSPEDAKLAMSADVKHFYKPPSAAITFRELLGDGGLLLVNGETWHTQRNILRPAFFADKLKEMVADMVASALDMVELWRKHVNTKHGQPTELEIAKDLKDVTADILARTSFGTSYLKGKTVFEKQVQLLELAMQQLVKINVIPGYRFFPTEANRKVRELERSMNSELREIVESRRQTCHSGNGSSESNGTDLLGLILDAEEQGVKQGNRTVRLSTREVIDQCKTFFVAGHEATANLLAWTMVLLSLNQDWQEKAREEVMEICGKEGEPKADHLNRMKILGMVLNESLRLYPPVPQHGNRTLDPKEGSFKLGQKTLPKGVAITVSSLYIHRRKDIWGEDADEFNPERFANGVARACSHPHGFMPFGIGPRICIGQQFAMMEAKVVMAVILQRFRFSLSPNYRHAPITTLTMRPQHGVQVILELLR